MDKQMLGMYLYMCSTEPIFEWLEKEGVKTRKQAIEKLEPLVQGNVYSFAAHIGGGSGGSLAGTANAVKKILEKFPEDE